AAGDRLRRRCRAAPAARRRDHRRPDREPGADADHDDGRLRAARQAAAQEAEGASRALFAAGRRRPGMRLAGVALALAIAGCAVGPEYQRPTAPVPAAYKEATTAAGATWLPAAKPDAFARGEWWRLFGDPELERLVGRIDVNNQNVVAQAAAYRQAQAVVREARAARFPTLGLTGSARRTGGREQAEVNAFQVSLGADWAP